ncbi:sirohydrochlorin chelatase [Streptomyces sp. CA-250714]|uniref:sirohydrochlorin chelatase n=1 Tax=Streptomyces sp. CA-250714 TaxID=3240060 RepID=UPI003D9317B3
MSSPTGPDNGLPVRMPRPRQPGRHRRPEPVVAPEGAPALVLAVPGTPSSAMRSLAEETLSIARSELPGLDARVGFTEGDGEEFPTIRSALAQAVTDRATRRRYAREAAAMAEEAAQEQEAAVAAPARGTADDGLPAVVVPLLAGPDAAQLRRIRQEVLNSGSGAELTDVLGPHPLLAEAVHVRLSEAGLARADRARLFTVATAADGIVLATVGGEEAVQAAGITGMLLAARLAVPVLAAALDDEGAIQHTAEQLRTSGSQQLAIAPCLIGPEIAEGLLEAAAEEAGCPTAEPLGAYPALGKLVASTYAAKAGIAQPQAPQGAPVR